MKNFTERRAAGEMICKVCGGFSSSQTCWNCLCVMQATEAERQKAIDANVGHWQIDAETGERNFVYGIITKEKTDDES